MPEHRPKTSETDFRVVEAGWPEHQAAIRAIRHAVFVNEQGIPKHLEWDGEDAGCIHVLALLADGRAVGTGRLLPDGRLGRMAVLPEWRGRGVGRAILRQLERLARGRDMAAVYLHAQAEAAGFYARAGFTAHGEMFEEAGIPHLEMVKRLDSNKSGR